MSWMKLDDGWLLNPKIRAMGLHARALYFASIGWSCQQLTDGHLPAHMLPVVAVLADVDPADTHAAMQRLVGIGAWIEATHADGWTIHAFHEYQPTRAQVLAKRAKAKRHHDLRQAHELKAQVRARDAGTCQYCWTPCIWTGPGSKSTFGGTFDHVDPDDAEPNTLDNVVVACRSCNSRKKDLTPEQAGMVLRPAPPAPEPAALEARQKPTPTPKRPRRPKRPRPALVQHTATDPATPDQPAEPVPPIPPWPPTQRTRGARHTNDPPAIAG